MNIQEIAKHCGVSTATVSRVLNNSPNVRESTRAKVLAVMEQEGYTPNPFARGLGLNTMNMVGLLCTDVSDQYYAKAVSLIESCLREKGYDVLLCCTGNALEDKKRYLELLLQKRVDAVMLIGSTFRESRDNSHIRRAAVQVPVFIINGLIPIPNVYCVLCDEQQAMEDNVRRLCVQGHRRILYLYDATTYSGVRKLEGYRNGVARHSRPGEDLVRRVEKSIPAARALVEELVKSGDSFTAVMAADDILAVGAQKALASLGRSIPIIGFNNSLTAECASPALTSVDNMLDTLCPTAASLLADLLAGKEIPPQITVSAVLRERETFRENPHPKGE